MSLEDSLKLIGSMVAVSVAGWMVIDAIQDPFKKTCRAWEIRKLLRQTTCAITRDIPGSSYLQERLYGVKNKHGELEVVVKLLVDEDNPLKDVSLQELRTMPIRKMRKILEFYSNLYHLHAVYRNNCSSDAFQNLYESRMKHEGTPIS